MLLPLMLLIIAAGVIAGSVALLLYTGAGGVAADAEETAPVYKGRVCDSTEARSKQRSDQQKSRSGRVLKAEASVGRLGSSSRLYGQSSPPFASGSLAINSGPLATKCPGCIYLQVTLGYHIIQLDRW